VSNKRQKYEDSVGMEY